MNRNINASMRASRRGFGSFSDTVMKPAAVGAAVAALVGVIVVSGSIDRFLQELFSSVVFLQLIIFAIMFGYGFVALSLLGPILHRVVGHRSKTSWAAYAMSGYLISALPILFWLADGRQTNSDGKRIRSFNEALLDSFKDQWTQGIGFAGAVGGLVFLLMYARERNAGTEKRNA